MSTDAFNSTTFNNRLDENQLVGSKCLSCGEIYLPPRPICPACLKHEMEWIKLQGTGRLAAFTVVHIAPTAMIEAGYGRDNPYCTGIVQLDDGPAVSAQILGVDVNNPSTIQIGTRLEVDILKRAENGNEKAFLAFRKVG